MSVNHTTYRSLSGFNAFPTYYLDCRSLLARANKDETVEQWNARLSKVFGQKDSKALAEWTKLVEIAKAQHLLVVGFTDLEAQTLSGWVASVACPAQFVAPTVPAAKDASDLPDEIKQAEAQQAE